MYKLLEPVAEKRTALEKMYDDPWFKMDSEPLPNPRASTVFEPAPGVGEGGNARASIFINAPGHHAYNVEDGVTIMDADTEAIAFSRNVFPLPGAQGAAIPAEPKGQGAQAVSNSGRKSDNKQNGTRRADVEVPLTGVWSRAGRLSMDPEEERRRSEDSKRKSEDERKKSRKSEG